MRITVGRSRHDVHWQTQEWSWEQLTERLSRVQRTPETAAEFAAMPASRKADIKDVGGFVGGELHGDRRKRANAGKRWLLTLDIDHAESGFWDRLTLLHDFRCVLYSTHSHTPEQPRLRLLADLTRPTSPEEYPALGRIVASWLGIDQFDDTTYEPTRLMYWPSAPSDGEYVFERQDGPALDVDAALGSLADWRDISQWPRSSREGRFETPRGTRQVDPQGKPGLVGAFCRAHSVTEAMQRFLPGVYTPTGDPGRWTYARGESSGGMVIYDGDLFAYSHHETDPAGGQLVNAFDLVRLHRFSDLDTDTKPGTPTNRLPSYGAMLDLARGDNAVKQRLDAEKQAEAETEFEPLTAGTELSGGWRERLTVDRKGRVAETLQNLEHILENDPHLAGVVLNEMSETLEITATVPWGRERGFWRDADDAQLQSYLARHYARFTERDYRTGLVKVADDRSYHPVRDYLDSLPVWDGIERVDTLLIDYLGAEDHPYTRAVTRKTLCAAVRRVQQPGCKFDHMLVLSGPQGAGKSTLIAKLAGEWFSDSLSLSDTHDKTAAEKLQGYWILEVGELAGLRRTEVETLRSFITRQDDIYRAAFGRQVVPHPRQCVFFATTNAEDGYLRDETGNRRFWPVPVTGEGVRKPWDIDEAARAQIWAEVLVRVAAGEPLHLDAETAEEARRRQAEALEVGELGGIIQEFLDTPLPDNWGELGVYDRRNHLRTTEFGAGSRVQGNERQSVSVAEVWCEALGRNIADLTKADSIAINRALQHLGWVDAGRRRLPIYGRQRVRTRAGQPGTKRTNPQLVPEGVGTC